MPFIATESLQIVSSVFETKRFGTIGQSSERLTLVKSICSDRAGHDVNRISHQ